jgi:ABC-type lipoprotein release transport system permease subunit
MLKNKINLYLLEYALNALLRQKYKTIFIMIVFTFLTFLLTAVFFIANAIKFELDSTLLSLPQITVQKIKAGRQYDIEVSRIEPLLNIAGVEDAIDRVWGYYFFQNAGVNFSVIGIDEFENQYRTSLENIVQEHDFSKALDTNGMIIGQGVQNILKENYYEEYFNFIKPDGSFKKVNIQGVFKSTTQLESNDVILLPKQTALEIFGMEEGMATDIVIKVANKDEIAMIASKIKLLFPDTRVISKEDFNVSYKNIFDYKSGVFLALFIVALFTFFIIIYDKSSGLSSEEKREIGILKAIGWTIDDVLKEKFYESFIVSFVAYVVGIMLAFMFVYLLQAPVLRNIFTGYSQLKTAFELPFVFDVQTLFLTLFLTVPIYIAATIIPSWKSATEPTDEMMR